MVELPVKVQVTAQASVLTVGAKTTHARETMYSSAAFVSRPKDPDNPTEALEGYYVITADLIKSFDGPLIFVQTSFSLIFCYEI